MKLRLIFLTLFVVMAQLGIAQVKFEAKVSKENLGLNERLRINFETSRINKEGSNFKSPSFNGFTIVKDPILYTVGSITEQDDENKGIGYTYYLEPIKIGNFIIEEASIEIDGEVYKTIPVKIQVTSAVQKSKDGSIEKSKKNENKT